MRDVVRMVVYLKGSEILLRKRRRIKVELLRCIHIGSAEALF